MKNVRACLGRRSWSCNTLVWTSGAGFPITSLGTASARSRRVSIVFENRTRPGSPGCRAASPETAAMLACRCFEIRADANASRAAKVRELGPDELHAADDAVLTQTEPAQGPTALPPVTPRTKPLPSLSSYLLSGLFPKFTSPAV
jgi:hypothetical protein